VIGLQIVFYSYPFSMWLHAFLWTLAFEIPFYTLILRDALGSFRRHLLVLLVINLTTHPLLWYLFPRFEPAWLWIWVAEAWVTLTEAWLLGILLSPKQAQRRGKAIWGERFQGGARWTLALLAAVCANTFSTLLGFLVVR
jgi:hypothetical protein